MFETMTYLNVLTVAATVAGLTPLLTIVLAAFWKAADKLWETVVDTVFLAVFISDTPLRHKVVEELFENSSRHHRFHNGGIGFVQSLRWVVSEERYRPVVETDQDNGAVLFWYRGALVLFNGNTLSHRYQQPGLRFLRGTLDVKALLARAEAAMVPQRKEPGGVRFFVHRVSGKERTFASGQHSNDSAPASGETKPECERLLVPALHAAGEVANFKPDDNPFATYAQSAETRRISDDLEFWMKSREWYAEKGVPWRRGYLLKGPGGTGKTSLVRALGQRWRVPVAAVDIATMDNRDLDIFIKTVKAWSKPFFVLIEDVDCTFEGRQNVAREDGVTFNKLLELTNGIEELEGCVFWLTTNHPEKLDPALIRPERIDVIAELPPLDDAGRRLIAESILDHPDDVEAVVRLGAGENGTYFKDRCVKLAVDRYWGRDVAAQHPDLADVVRR